VLLVVVLLIAAVTPDEGVAAVKLSSAPAAAWEAAVARRTASMSNL
jgi:hypothetical protein